MARVNEVKVMSLGRTKKRTQVIRSIYRDKYLFMLLLPVIAYYVIFKYGPMLGEVIAFKNYRISDGIWGSQWVGLDQFRRLFSSNDFFQVLRNTLLLNLYSIVFAFPVPIILALMLNEVRKEWYKKLIQNLLYIPHFISWVVLGGIVIALLSPSTGIINYGLVHILGIEPVYFMINKLWWPVAFILSGIWQSAGWGTILYLAAMAGIDPQLYEAAKMDGASRLRQVWNVTLPGIRSTIAILLVLRMGHVMDVGFEHIYALQNDSVLSVSNVISTYVYNYGVKTMQYSYTTALGLFQGVIGLILVVSVNKLVKRMGEDGLW
ncbi:ABC transporter permease [Paenibacillus roseipurpureus]|uniref:ABC transporter permease subunit n=1 Tax=Paenibacillus roseopurpureus TaxID=2918901 RepID=A0AA96LRJ7_9BACL|nr:ABC transporter permease subunit [Paenibacillus sp. MBLB1832]WNR45266.1 ABC transporter permease subunit [Paenibacillus sp. MBLB1832]